MTKIQFLLSLHDKLSGLDENELEERLSFYSEMIDDTMEEGLSEEEAVASIGTVDSVYEQIISETPLTKLIKDNIKKKKRKVRAGELLLIILGFPLWLPLLIAFLAVILTLYIALWVVIICLWSVLASLCATSLGAIAGGCVFCATDNLPSGIAMIGAGIFLAGLSILMLYACRAATHGTVLFSKRMAVSIKKCFAGKGKA